MEFDKVIKLPWREMIDILLQDGPKNCTWSKVRDYVEKTYSQEQIIQVNIKLWSCLDAMDDVQIDGEEADDIRDISDIWWYAVDNIEELHKALASFRKDKENVIG
jgi:hypothetical protein